MPYRSAVWTDENYLRLQLIGQKQPSLSIIFMRMYTSNYQGLETSEFC